MKYSRPNVQKADAKKLPAAANFAPPPAEDQGTVAKDKKQAKDAQNCNCKKK